MDVKSPGHGSGGGGGGLSSGRTKRPATPTSPQPAHALDFFQQPRLVATNCTSCKRTLMANSSSNTNHHNKPPSKSGNGAAAGTHSQTSDLSGSGDADSSGSGNGTSGSGGGGMASGDGEDDFFFIPTVNKRIETSNLDRQSLQMTQITEIVTNKSDYDDMICEQCTNLLTKEFRSYEQQYQLEHAAFTAALAAITSGELNALHPKHYAFLTAKSAPLIAPSPAASIVSLHPSPTSAPQPQPPVLIPYSPVPVTEQMLSEDRRAERKLIATLTQINHDRRALSDELADVAADRVRMKRVESVFWPQYQDFKYQMDRFNEKRNALRGKLAFAEAELARMKHTRVAHDAFHIFTDETGKLGTINGLRLGMLGTGELPRPVEWPEIGAALGQIALLLTTIAKHTQHTFSTYQFRVAGSYSRIDKRSTATTTTAAAAGGGNAPLKSNATSAANAGSTKLKSPSAGTDPSTTDGSSMELFWNGDLGRFNNGLVRLLTCLRELTDRAGLNKLKDQFKPILTDKIGSVSIQLATVVPCTVDPTSPSTSMNPTPASSLTTGSHSTRAAGSGSGASGSGSGGSGSSGGRARSSSNASTAGSSITSPVRTPLPADHLTKCAGCRARKEWSRACKYLLIDLKLLLVVWTKTLSHSNTSKYR